MINIIKSKINNENNNNNIIINQYFNSIEACLNQHNKKIIIDFIKLKHFIFCHLTLSFTMFPAHMLIEIEH